ncbi:transmembrane protein, partial [Tanacetum coccineum]
GSVECVSRYVQEYIPIHHTRKSSVKCVPRFDTQIDISSSRPSLALAPWIYHPNCHLSILDGQLVGSFNWPLISSFTLFAGIHDTAFEGFENNISYRNNWYHVNQSSCSNSSTSEIFMAQIGYSVHKYIAESNSHIILLAHKMVQSNEQNDNSFVIERICDPFSRPPNYSYAPGNCQQDALQIHDLPSVSVSIH